MSGLLYRVGDRVLASRTQDGENHEEGTVVDAHQLIIGEETRPIVVVEFEDGKREFFTATEPELKERIAALADAGYDEIAIQIVQAGEEIRIVREPLLRVRVTHVRHL